jgi:hypothetical protein
LLFKKDLEESGGRKNETSITFKIKNEKSKFYDPGLEVNTDIFGITVTGQCIRDFIV